MSRITSTCNSKRTYSLQTIRLLIGIVAFSLVPFHSRLFTFIITDKRSYSK